MTLFANGHEEFHFLEEVRSIIREELNNFLYQRVKDAGLNPDAFDSLRALVKQEVQAEHLLEQQRDSDCLPTAAAAAFLGIMKGTMLRLANRGIIPSDKPDGFHISFRRYDLEAYKNRVTAGYQARGQRDTTAMRAAKKNRAALESAQAEPATAENND